MVDVADGLVQEPECTRLEGSGQQWGAASSQGHDSASGHEKAIVYSGSSRLSLEIYATGPGSLGELEHTLEDGVKSLASDTSSLDFSIDAAELLEDPACKSAQLLAADPAREPRRRGRLRSRTCPLCSMRLENDPNA